MGTSDGTYQGRHYFKCGDDYGLFLSLDKLALHPEEENCHSEKNSEPHGGGNVPGFACLTGNQDTLSQKTSSKSAATTPESKVDNASVLQIGDGVSFYDNKGKLLTGNVIWTGNCDAGRKFDYNVVGIQTVSSAKGDVYKYCLIVLGILLVSDDCTLN